MVLKPKEICQRSEAYKEIVEAGATTEIQEREENLIKRLQKAEELAARQTAQLMLEEKRRKEMEIIRKTLENEVKRQHELLQINLKGVEEVKGSQSEEKIINEGEGDEAIDEDMVVEDKLEEGGEMTEQELMEQAIGLGYVEPVDYTASQET